MRRLQELHNKHKLDKRYYKRFHLNHTYDRKLKTWRFVGYKCTICDRIVRADKNVDHHARRCTKRKLVVLADRYEENDEVIVMTKDRTVWSKLETNQKLPE